MKVTTEMATAIHRSAGKSTYSFFQFMEAGKKGEKAVYVCLNGEFHSPQSLKENFISREIIERTKNVYSRFHTGDSQEFYKGYMSALKELLNS